jgi:predicted nucleic acid-binding Zn ribbon protein
MAAQDRPRPLGEVLKEVIDQLGLQDKIDEARVIELWAAIAGDDINRVTESVWMKGATLYVKVTSAAWRQELHMNRRQWRDRLNGEFESDPVEEIVFR